MYRNINIRKLLASIIATIYSQYETADSHNCPLLYKRTFITSGNTIPAIFFIISLFNCWIHTLLCRQFFMHGICSHNPAHMCTVHRYTWRTNLILRKMLECGCYGGRFLRKAIRTQHMSMLLNMYGMNFMASACEVLDSQKVHYT